MNDRWQGHAHGGNGVYFFGFLGAAIFFISKAATFTAGIIGFLKAIVWPAFMVYYVLQLLIK